MNKYPGIPELLEAFMEEQGADERWVTVQELRAQLGLTRYQGNTLSGFLRRLHCGSFGQFPFIVGGIVREDAQYPSDPRKCWYLLKRRTPRAACRRNTGKGGTFHSH